MGIKAVTTANFQEDLAFSHAQADQPFWRDVYVQAFPDMAAMTDVRKDGWAQRGGIDRIITTSTGTVWKIDEKVRRKDYGDILLEYTSNSRTNAPGWVVKELACDFIAYAIVSTCTCYLLPVAPLQRAWRTHHMRWISEYGQVAAVNASYQTISCPVPIPELMHKISQAMFFRWK